MTIQFFNVLNNSGQAAFRTRFQLPPQQVKASISAGAEALASHPAVPGVLAK